MFLNGGEGVEGSAVREFFPLNPIFSLRAPHELSLVLEARLKINFFAITVLCTSYYGVRKGINQSHLTIRSSYER